MILYHDSHENQGFEITDSGMFGGIFAGENGGMYAPNRHKVELEESEILTHDDFNHLAYARDDEPEYEQYNTAVKILRKYVDSEEQIDDLWELVAEERTDDDRAAELLGIDDVAEASWELQRIRGEIARELGYSAVECRDETGTSYLVLKGRTTFGKTVNAQNMNWQVRDNINRQVWTSARAR